MRLPIGGCPPREALEARSGQGVATRRCADRADRLVVVAPESVAGPTRNRLLRSRGRTGVYTPEPGDEGDDAALAWRVHRGMSRSPSATCSWSGGPDRQGDRTMRQMAIRPGLAHGGCDLTVMPTRMVETLAKAAAMGWHC